MEGLLSLLGNTSFLTDIIVTFCNYKVTVLCIGSVATETSCTGCLVVPISRRLPTIILTPYRRMSLAVATGKTTTILLSFAESPKLAV